MIRIHIICEGTTEYNFVNKVLYPYFILRGKELIPHNLRGGFNYERLKHNVKQWLNYEQSAYVTTMIDLYGANRRYPQYIETLNLPALEKIVRIETAIKQDVLSSAILHNDKFIPYLQLHEFEALLFSNPTLMEEWFSLEYTIKKGCFQEIRDKYETPEDINDSPHTAPSKQILAIVPAYQDMKTSEGILIAEDIGLTKLREECTHFNNWLTQLENLDA
jgi:Domain of unknown function (DUF4276)